MHLAGQARHNFIVAIPSDDGAFLDRPCHPWQRYPSLREYHSSALSTYLVSDDGSDTSAIFVARSSARFPAMQLVVTACTLGYAPSFKQLFYTRQTAGDVARDFGCTAAVECAQRQLCARLANGLRRDNAHRRADIDHFARAQVAPVAQRADAVNQVAGQGAAHAQRCSSARVAGSLAAMSSSIISLRPTIRSPWSQRINNISPPRNAPRSVHRLFARRYHPSGISASRDWYCNPSG